MGNNRDVIAVDSPRSNNKDVNFIANKTLRLSNVVEGNDIILHDVLNTSQQQMCNSDNVFGGNNIFESSTTPQATNLSQELTLSFECDNEGFIMPCLDNSLHGDSRKRKHPQLGLLDT